MQKNLKSVIIIKEIINDPDRKSIILMIWEILTLTVYLRSFPRLYFSYYLFKKYNTNIKNYYLAKYLNGVKSLFNDKEIKDAVENKLFFDFYYSQFNISLPKILMYNHKNFFIVGKKNVRTNSVSEFKSLLNDLFDQNPCFDSIIIKRTYGSYGGSSVFKLFRHQLVMNDEIIGELYAEVTTAGYLFQETVKQHQDLNALNPSCLNTMRLDTFISKDGIADVISGFLRMSTSNLHVDNGHMGGYAVGINLESGKLKKYGYSSITKDGVKVLKIHPVTNTVFENYQIPFFNESKQLVVNAATLMPGLRLIGWDVAIGETGPVLIEGNSDYAIPGSDMLSGGYRSNPVFKKILNELSQGKNGFVG